MKKILQLILVFALVLSFMMVFALADENTTVNDTVDVNDTVNNDSEEVDAEDFAAFQTANGAKMRLLQLERSLVRQLDLAEQIIGVVNESSVLEIIYEQLVDLKDAVILEEESVNTTDRNSAKVFVDLKHSAIRLSKEFRAETRNVMTLEERTLLKDSLNVDDETRDEIDDLTDEIEENTRAHNAERFQKLFARFGITNHDMVERVLNGDASIGEAKKDLKERYTKFSKEKKERAAQKLKEHAIKSKVLMSAKKDAIRANFDERMNDRREDAENKREELKARFEVRKTTWEDRREADLHRFEERRKLEKNTFEDRREAFKNRFGSDDGDSDDDSGEDNESDDGDQE